MKYKPGMILLTTSHMGFAAVDAKPDEHNPYDTISYPSNTQIMVVGEVAANSTIQHSEIHIVFLLPNGRVAW